MTTIMHPRLAATLVSLAVAGSLLVAPVAFATDMGADVDYDLVFPVDGEHHFSDTFWAGRSHGFHVGQDIMADKMTPVVAAADGVVRLVNWTAEPHMNPSRCCTLVIRHDDGWESWYIHLDNDTTGTDDGKGWGIKRAITPGVRVVAGQHIAWVGDSGNAEGTAPHLHYELRNPDGVVVNAYSSLVVAGGNDVGSGPRDPLVGGSRVLKSGVDGADVRVLQNLLDGLGYDLGRIDGFFGSKTDAAVRRFQSSVGMTVDGLVGRETKTALSGLSRGSADSEVLLIGSRGDPVRELQRGLNDLGFDAGRADGVFGPITLRAVLEFQRANSLWVDGLVGPRTRAALLVK
ncbi:MAG: peptidoglycan-binding protein [Actinomycetota bacterium]|nr:peptidoglycan-binding protein [Actinomycetota bacterium]